MSPSNEDRVAASNSTQSNLDTTISLSSEDVNDLLDANQDLKAPELIAAIKKWARGTKLATKNVNALDRICDRLLGTLATHPALQQLTERLDALDLKLDRQARLPVTYAAVASSRPPAPDPTPKKTTRTDKISIKINRHSAAEDKVQGSGEVMKEWVESAFRSSGVAGLRGTEVMGVQPHWSGTKITVRFRAAADVQQVVKGASKCSLALGAGAKVSVPHYGVVINEVPLFYDPADPNTRRDLQAQNPHLIPDTDSIVDLRWLVPKGRIPPGRRTGSWVLIFSNHQAADNIIDQSLKVQSLLLGARRYFSGPRQCRRCSKWGHVRAQCRAKTPACARCTGAHDLAECSHQGPPRCVNCNESHEAFASQCAIRREEQARAQALQAGANTYFAGENFEFQPFTSL